MNRSIIFFLLFLGTSQLIAQDISYAFENAQITNAGPFDSYEVDVVASSTAAFKLGSGQLYFNYNTAAFGSSVVGSGNLTIATSGGVLGQTSGPFPIYTSFISNDNTVSRFSFSWQQALSAGCMTDNITNTNSVVFHIRLDYINGGSSFASGLCFESVNPFDDQTFTACGPGGSCAFPDCIASPGTQIVMDAYDCSGSALPVSLTRFVVAKAGEEAAEAKWSSEQEWNSHYYQLERSIDTRKWQPIHLEAAAGFSNQPVNYSFTDKTVRSSGSSTLYYRLKMVDLDGQFEYSGIQAVSFDFGALPAGIKVYPVPASEGVYVDLPSDTASRKLLFLYDSGGRLLRSSKTDESVQTHYLEFDGEIRSGVYWLIVQTADGEKYKQAIVVSR